MEILLYLTKELKEVPSRRRGILVSTADPLMGRGAQHFNSCYT